jgi:integrase
MGLYQRKDSPYWWLWIEATKAAESSGILIGETVAQRRDAKRLAEEAYQRRMLEIAEQKIRPMAAPVIRFSAYADAYARDVIPLRRGARRELEMLKPLRRFFDGDLLSKIDADRVRAYMAARKVSPRTVNREIDLIKGMLRDAVPKYLTVSPIAGLKRIKPAPVKRRLLTPAEEKRILAACADAQDTALIVLGIDTLIRLGDLLDLERTDRDVLNLVIWPLFPVSDPTCSLLVRGLDRLLLRLRHNRRLELVNLRPRGSAFKVPRPCHMPSLWRAAISLAVVPHVPVSIHHDVVRLQASADVIGTRVEFVFLDAVAVTARIVGAFAIAVSKFPVVKDGRDAIVGVAPRRHYEQRLLLGQCFSPNLLDGGRGTRMMALPVDAPSRQIVLFVHFASCGGTERGAANIALSFSGVMTEFASRTDRILASSANPSNSRSNVSARSCHLSGGGTPASAGRRAESSSAHSRSTCARSSTAVLVTLSSGPTCSA